MRRSAKLLGIDRKTVARRISYLAQKSRLALAASTCSTDSNEAAPKIHSRIYAEIYIDELITFEHTRCKPLAVCMAVSRERKILAFSVSSMPPIEKNLKQIFLK